MLCGLTLLCKGGQLSHLFSWQYGSFMMAVEKLETKFWGEYVVRQRAGFLKELVRLTAKSEGLISIPKWKLGSYDAFNILKLGLKLCIHVFVCSKNVAQLWRGSWSEIVSNPQQGEGLSWLAEAISFSELSHQESDVPVSYSELSTSLCRTPILICCLKRDKTNLTKDRYQKVAWHNFTDKSACSRNQK